VLALRSFNIALSVGGNSSVPAAQPELRLALTNAFITPIDSEDIYVMSERLDAVLNGAKDTVRQAEVMGMEPDEAVAAMATLLADGARQLATAFERLDPDRRLSRVSEMLIEAADRVWYATVKEGGAARGPAHGPVRELRPTRQPV
jgi:hypothetical protein